MEHLLLLFLLVPTSIWATSNAASLYFTTLNSIQLLNNNASTVVLEGLEQAESCDVCGQTIFWVELLGKIKKGVPNDQSSIQVVIDKDLRHPVGLAVDCKGNNVYFSDTRNAEGQGRIEVTSYNGKQRKVLLHNLDRPGPLALNLLTGHLYYIDQFGIKRISTDGSLDQQLVYFEVDEIKDLAVDVINNLLYWTVGTHIKYLNMTHWETLTQTQRDNVVPETVRSGFDGAVPHGISVINNTIYWTEDRQVSQENQEVTRPGAIYSLNLATSTAQRLLQDDNLSPRDLCAFLNTSMHHDGCAINNGNCQHFCFTVPDRNGGTRPQCGCPTGIKLRADNRTCPEAPSEFLLFTQTFHNHSEIRQISLDFPGRYIDALVPIDNLGEDVSFLSYDLVLRQIYWTEVDPPAIKRAYFNGSSVETFIGTGLKYPKGVAVDSYSRNLYWVDSALNRIEVARLSNSKNRRVLFSSYLDHPQGLALDLHQGYMYWTDLDISNPKVERAHMDGTGRVNLPNVAYTIKTPTNIAVDPLTGWVYWSEADSEVERVSRYNGFRDFSLSLSDTEDVFGLAIHGDYIYWTDRFLSSRALVRAEKSTGDEEEVILVGYPGLRGLVAVNSTAETVSTGCHLTYGNCEQLCLPSETSTPTCSCRDNYIINGNQCKDPNPHAYISSGTIVAAFQVILTTHLQRWRRSIGRPSFNITASAIDIDYRESMLYWISSVDKLIYRQYVNLTSTSEPQAVVTCCLVAPEDLAVDWLGRNLYWTDSNRQVIEVAKLDGGGRTILAQVNESLGSPSLIALDSTRGHLYWVPKSQPKIYKMRMDGSSPPELFWSADNPTASEKIIGIAMNYEDTPNDVIYWGTQTTDISGVLWRKELTGSQTVRNIKMLDEKPLHIATFKYSVYYHYQRIVFGDFINIYNTQQQSDNQVLSRGNRGTIQDFTDFVMVHHSLQPGIHECGVLNRGCGGDDILCLISNKLDGVCQCPTTMYKQVYRDVSGHNRTTCISTNVTVGVTRQAMSVLEGEVLQFCLKILEGEVEQEALAVAVSSFNGTAFAGSDYTPVSTNLVFVPGSGVGAEACTFTQVMSDTILESAEETFSIQAHPSKGQSQLVNIPADQQDTLVTIVDTNIVAVGFEQQSYTVTEGTPALDVCVLLSGALFRTTALARPVRVRVTSHEDTATAGEDYIEVTPRIMQFPISFERAEGRWCITLQIIDDQDYEGELPESFVISLSISDTAVIMNQASATVSILDEEPSRNVSGPLKVYFSDNTPLVNGFSITVQVFTSKPATAICRLGKTKTTCPPGSTTTFQNLLSGHYNFHVTATTADGEEAEVSWKMYIPIASTTCSVNLINAGLVVNGTQATVEFQAVGAATGFKCKVDNRPFDPYPCVSPKSYNGLSPGDHRLRIVPEGCRSIQGQTYHFTV